MMSWYLALWSHLSSLAGCVCPDLLALVIVLITWWHFTSRQEAFADTGKEQENSINVPCHLDFRTTLVRRKWPGRARSEAFYDQICRACQQLVGNCVGMHLSTSDDHAEGLSLVTKQEEKWVWPMLATSPTKPEKRGRKKDNPKAECWVGSHRLRGEARGRKRLIYPPVDCKPHRHRLLSDHCFCPGNARKSSWGST